MPDEPDAELELARPKPFEDPADRWPAVLAATGLDGPRVVIGVLAAVALVVGAIVLWPRPASAPPELSMPRASTTIAAGAAPATTVATEIVVHVAGEVARPGVYRLDPAARVDDAVAAAGGPTAGADHARVNLAAPLADGERVFVPAVGQQVPEVAVGSTPSTPTAPDGGGAGAAVPVNVNTASLEELDTLPGVGPATAQAIIDHRTQHGPFSSVDQLLDVRGIGDAKLAELRDRVTV